MHGPTHIVDLEELREKEALDRCRSGNASGLATLYDLYAQKVFRTCFRILGDRRTAEDMTQDIFIGLLGKLGDFRAQSAFSTWLYRVSVNQSLNALRARKRRLARFLPMLTGSEDRWQSPSSSPEKSAMQRQAHDQVERLLTGLSTEHRVAIVLREIEGLSYREMAEVLDVPVGTVMSRLSRARKSLRKRWVAEREGNTSAGSGVQRVNRSS